MAGGGIIKNTKKKPSSYLKNKQRKNVPGPYNKIKTNNEDYFKVLTCGDLNNICIVIASKMHFYTQDVYFKKPGK